MDVTSRKCESFRESWGEGSYKIEASAQVCGNDLVVVIAGGTSHHIGAVALAVPRPSLSEPGRISASASVLCVTGHKEDELARSISLQLASALNCVVTVVAGIHIEEATGTDIGKLMDNCTQVIKSLQERLNPN